MVSLCKFCGFSFRKIHVKLLARENAPKTLRTISATLAVRFFNRYKNIKFFTHIAVF